MEDCSGLRISNAQDQATSEPLLECAYVCFLPWPHLAAISSWRTRPYAAAFIVRNPALVSGSHVIMN
jgi:hypothetical protein